MTFRKKAKYALSHVCSILERFWCKLSAVLSCNGFFQTWKKTHLLTCLFNFPVCIWIQLLNIDMSKICLIFEDMFASKRPLPEQILTQIYVAAWCHKTTMTEMSKEYALGWLVGNRGGTFIQCIKAKYKCRPRRALSRTNHINAAHLSNSSSWAFQKLCIHICIYIMLLSSYLCVRVVQCVRGPMCA